MRLQLGAVVLAGEPGHLSAWPIPQLLQEDSKVLLGLQRILGLPGFFFLDEDVQNISLGRHL